MNDQAQRIAIAEARGIVKKQSPYFTEQTWLDTGEYGYGQVLTFDQLPPLDLNAMHEAEHTLSEQDKRTFRSKLFIICGGYAGREVHATELQRAEAFLRTIGKWEQS